MNGNLVTQSALLAGAATVSVFALGFPIRWALVRWNVVDRPNERSSHTRPTPRGGGSASMLAIFVIAATAETHQRQIQTLAMVLAVTAVLAIVSFVDDLRSLSPLIRFVCQALAAVVTLATLGWPHLALGLSNELTAL